MVWYPKYQSLFNLYIHMAWHITFSNKYLLNGNIHLKLSSKKSFNALSHSSIIVSIEGLNKKKAHIFINVNAEHSVVENC